MTSYLYNERNNTTCSRSAIQNIPCVGGKGLGPRNDVLTTCKATHYSAAFRKGGKNFRGKLTVQRAQRECNVEQ